MGWINVRGLRVNNASIGVHDHERQTPQPVIVDFSVCVDVHKAALTDQLDHTVDYTRLVQMVTEVCQRRHFFLLETLCDVLAVELLERFAVRQVMVEVHKPSALPSGCVSVRVERQR